MENQINIGDQNSQQIRQNPINQPTQNPVKPKVNYWLVLTMLFVFLFLGILGWYIFDTLQGKSKQKVGSLPTQQPTSSATINASIDPLKFIYYEPTEVGQRDNLNSPGGYQHIFTIFDIPTKTKEIIYQEVTVFDQMTHPITRNQYIDIGSEEGNKRIDLTAQSTPNLTEEYLPEYNSDWNKPGLTMKDLTTFVIYNNRENTSKEIKWPWPDEKIYEPVIFTEGYSNDENIVFFRLGGTESRDPQQTLYIANIKAQTIEKFPRDKIITDIRNTYVDTKNNEIYYIASKGIFVQKIDSLKATPIQVKNLNSADIYNIVLPNKYKTHSIAIASNKKLIILNIDTGDEKVIFEETGGGNLSEVLWYGNYIVFFLREQIVSEKNVETGNIYSLKTNQSIEFVKRETREVQRRIEFVGWL